MWWLLNELLEGLNGSNYDPEIIDRTLEWGEALECLKRADQGIVISKAMSETDFMMQEYQMYLQEHEPEPRQSVRLDLTAQMYSSTAESKELILPL